MRIKDKSCNSPEGQQLYLKKRLQHRCFPLNIPKVLGTAFFIEQLWWLFLNYVLVLRKEFKEKKVSGEIAFAAISLLHAQIHKLANRSTILREFVFLAKFAEFYYHKKFETRRP